MNVLIINLFPRLASEAHRGFADTGDRRQDRLHLKNIATPAEKYTDSITAVIILANGTVKISIKKW